MPGPYSNDQGNPASGTPTYTTYTPNASLVFASSIPTTANGTPLYSGGVAARRLVIFNNSPTAVLWVNEAGANAVVGSGIRIGPSGASYTWNNGLTTIPNGISDGGGAATAVVMSGAGG